MSKRAASQTRDGGVPLKQGERPEGPDEDDMGPFEDDQEDIFEDEIVEIDGEGKIVRGEGDSEDGDGGKYTSKRYQKQENHLPDSRPSLTEAMDVDITRDQQVPQTTNQTFIPGRTPLEKGQILEPDESAYEMLHRLEPPWPCLSFDIIRDHLGSGRARKKYPATVYAVAGTQAALGHEKENELLVMKMSKLARNERAEEDSESDDDSDDDESSDPILETKRIPLAACTNRVRARQLSETEAASSTNLSSTGPFPPTFAASMSESGNVYIHNITPHLTAFDTPGTVITPAMSQPVHTITAHGTTEGFALAWSPPLQSHAGKLHLLTGDSSGKIFLTTGTPSPSGYVWSTKTAPFTGHTSSIEDLSFSPSEATVFASASADGTVRIWDTRSKSRKPALSVSVSTTDVNVLAWSTLTPHLLASGHDDGSWAVWDLRTWKPHASGGHVPITPGQAVASYTFHSEQITSLAWHPSDDSVIAVAAADNTLTLWDLAVEFDDEESRDTADVKDVPAALLFVHYAETVKEACWHPQMEGVVMCTGGSGFNVLRTISV